LRHWGNIAVIITLAACAILELGDGKIDQDDLFCRRVNNSVATNSAVHCTDILYNSWDYADMQTVNISELRSNLLKYLEKANSGEQISVTTNGKLLATITPPIDQKQLAQQQLEQLAKSAQLMDIVSPTDAEWEENT
jgi:prevent-host-death family protein